MMTPLKLELLLELYTNEVAGSKLTSIQKNYMVWLTSEGLAECDTSQYKAGIYRPTERCNVYVQGMLAAVNTVRLPVWAIPEEENHDTVAT